MNIKSFILGLVTGIVLTFGGFVVIGNLYQASMETESETESETDPIHYLEHPVSYEDKKETSFRVFQVIGEAALAHEVSDKKYKMYMGNTVVILGKDFYNDQVVVIKNPQRIGTYSYTNKGGMPMTVPVLEMNTEDNQPIKANEE